MNTKHKIINVNIACLVLALASQAGTAHAQSSLSDRLQISGTTGVFDQTISENAGVAEPPLAYGGALTPATPASLFDLLALQGINVVALTEPAGSPLEPGESPVTITVNGTQVTISDLIVSDFHAVGNLPNLIELFSDGNVELQALTGLPANTVFLPETGQFQDITQALGIVAPDVFGVTSVKVLSDVATPTVPDQNSTWLLTGIACLALAAVRRRLASKPA